MLSRRDLLLATLAAPAVGDDSPRPPRDFLCWRAPDGTERRVKSAREWEPPRREILAAMERVLGANFDLTGVRELMPSPRSSSRLSGPADRLEALHPDCAHDWPVAMGEAAYHWLDRWLRK